MSARVPTSRANGTGRARARALLVLGGAVALAGVLGVVAQATTKPAYDATAKIAPALYYIGDSTGSLYTFTVTNTGTTASIGAVEIRRPSTIWTMSGCVAVPGWTSQLSADKCRYRSAASSADDIKPGQSRTFKVGAKTAAGNVNRVGTWPVVVSKSNHFDTPSLLRGARPTGSGLTTTLFTFELTTAVVTTGLPAPGTPCPPASKDAVRGSVVTIVTCGRNRANVALQPISAYSSVKGTLIDTPGPFSSGVIQPKSGNVVLARWPGTEVIDVYGTGKKVVTQVGSWSNRTSPLRTFTGYNVISTPADALADAHTTAEDTPLSVAAPGVLANDSDPNGDALTAVDASDPAHGTVTMSPDGSFTYTPDPDFNGTDSFTYKAFDSFSKSAATVTITVTPVPDAPIGGDDAISTTEDAATTIAVLGNDTDADADTLAITAVDTTGVLGSVTNNGTSISYDPNGQFEHLRPAQTATETITYTVSDGSLTDTATVTVTVTGINDLPVATDDSAIATEDLPETINVLANDTDDEGVLTVTAVMAGTGGTPVDNGDGTVTFTPASDFSGAASFAYTVTDVDGATDTATVLVDVVNVNDLPDAVDDVATVSEDATDQTLLVLANDVDADGNTLSIVGIDTSLTNGQVTNHGTHVTYTPGAAFQPLGADDDDLDSFTYTVEDGLGGTDTATVVITVDGVNDLPVVADDTVTTAEDTAATVSVLGNDTDAEGPLTVTSAGNATNGTVTDNGDGTVTFTPAANFNGTGSFDYTATDSNGASDTGTVTVTVTPVNDAPQALADAATFGEDSTGATVLVLGNDSDVEGDTLTVSSVDTTGTTGVVTNNGTDVTYDPNGAFEHLAEGEPASDTFTYTVSDGNGGTHTATVTITIDGVNDAPVAVDDVYQAIQDTALAVPAPGVLTNDLDVDTSDTKTASNASDPANGTVTLNPDGSFTYTPDTGFTGSDTFTYDVSDGTSTDTATATVNVVPPNAVPTVDATSASGNEDGGAITVTLTGHDDDGDALTFTAGTATNGLVTVPGPVACDSNTPSTCTATVTYTPNADFFGTDTFTYSVNDGTVDSATAVATVTVNAVNDAPSFTKGADQTVLEDAAAQTVNGWATAISAGPANESGQAVTFTVTTDNDALFSTLPAVSPGGGLTYTPAPDANGVATVTVTAADDGGIANGGVDTSAPQTFTITVTAVNDAPSFTKGANQTLNEDAGAQSITNWASAISKGPANESAQTLSFTTSNNNNALFSVQPGVTPTGTLVFTTAPNKYGSATVTITLSDNGGTANGGVDTSPAQTFTITVNAVNDAPVAAAKSYTVQANMKISLSGLLTGATDPNDSAGDPSWAPTFTVGSITPGAGCVGCTVSNVNLANGTFDFDPPAGGAGTYTLNYTVVDDGHPAPGATSAPQTITMTVNGPVIWFVDTTAPAGGTGRLSAPFDNLGAAVTAMGSTADHRIFVRGGNVSGNLTLPTDGWLISEAATGASFDSVMAITPPAGTIARPAVNGTQRTLAGTVTLGERSVVRGFDITRSGSNKGIVASGKTGLVVNQVAVSTTAGRAVDLANSSGVFTLRRVDSNGADRGISLVNTNASTGSFTVTGTGTAGSGGTIANSTGAGTTDAGIHLSNTRNVSFDRIVVSTGQGSGIYGSAVDTFSLANSTIQNNGTNEVNDHSGLNFTNLTGTVSLSSITVFGSREDNAKITNNAGTANITLSNSTLRDNNATVGANGLLVNALGSSVVTFTGTNNSFLRNHTSGLALFGQSTQRMTVNVTGGTYVTDNGVGLDIETNGTGGMLFSVNGGTVTGCASCAAPVNVYKGTGATGTGANATAGTISGMTVTNGNSLNIAGIHVHGEGPGAARIAITNNHVSQVDHHGIWVSFGSNSSSPNVGAQSADITLTGNTVDFTGVTGIKGIQVDSGLLSGDTTAMCAHISGNTVTQPNDADIQVRNRMANTTFRLPGYAGSATDMTAVASFLQAQNTVADASAFKGAANTAGFAGGAACAAP